MSNCADCKYDFFNWCIEREILMEHLAKDVSYSTCDECPHFVQQEEQDEVDRD